MSDNTEENKSIEQDEFERMSRTARNKRHLVKSKKNLYRTLFFPKIFLMLFFIIAIYFIGRLKFWYLNPHAFDNLNNQSIKIENNVIVPSDRILKAIQSSYIPNKPIYLLDVSDIKSSIMEITPIQNVYIKRFWLPSRLEVIVQEREPAITIAPNENVPPIAFYTKDGVLVGRNYLPLSSNFKTIKVLTYGGCSMSSKFDKDKIKFLLTIAKDIESYSKEPIQYIDIRNPDDIYVQIPTVKIKLGSVSPITYPDTLKKIAGLPSILPKVKILDKKVKYVDLRWQNNLYYIKLAE